MKLFGARALIPILVCTSGLVACLDTELELPDDTAWQTHAIWTEVDQAHAVIIIDRTGSMTTRRANGNTRCRDAVEQALTDAETFFRDRQGQGVAFWLFNGSIGIQQVGPGYYRNMTDARNALASVNREGCPPSSNTPLADTLCQVADGFAPGSALLSPLPGAMYVETDGLENASVGPCRGPSGPPNVPGTWQNNVFMALFFGGISVHTQYWLPNGQITQLDDSPGIPIDIETGKPMPGVITNATCATQAACESALFGQLAFWTDGLYGVVTDADTAYTCTYGSCPAPKPPQ